MSSLKTTTMAQWPGGLIIDHTCIDLGAIPAAWIDAAQDDVRVHYAHTSHGGQITEGLGRIESDNLTFAYSRGSGTLPTDENALCMLDGNPPHSYITPELYWQGASAVTITQTTLDNNPTLTVSLWSWCTQLNGYTEPQTQEYLDAMAALEAANPSITFVYMTCNAQSSGGSGYNRWLRNEQIRQYRIDNNKVLFDFADLDCWSNGVQNTYEHIVGESTYDIPLEHEDFNGNEAGHTTYTSCEQKGRAFWWLMAMLAGWNASTSSTTSTTTDDTGTTTSTTNTDTGTPELLGMPLIIASLGAVVIVIVAFVVVSRRS
ncbi:MAG: hypothetical protein ACTSPR_04665 [Candidatus Thorarchaeota archaeon]